LLVFSTALTTIIFIVGVLALDFLGALPRDTTVTTLLAILAYFILSSYGAIATTYFNAAGKYGWCLFISCATPAVSAILILLFDRIVSTSVFAVIFIQLIAWGAALSIALSVRLNRTMEIVRNFFRASRPREAEFTSIFVQFASYALPLTLAGFFFTFADRFMIARFFSLSDVGRYSYAFFLTTSVVVAANSVYATATDLIADTDLDSVLARITERAATAIELARLGAAVMAVDINGDGAEATASSIREGGGSALSYAGDVANVDTQEHIVATVLQKFGALHYAVNNAGISGLFGALPDITVDDWRRVVNVNLDAIFYGMKFQLPAIEAAGGGAVVNIASIYAHLGLPRLDAYTASKHAVRGLTRSVAIEYATRGIRINAVSPGPILTPLVEANPEQSARIAAKVPMKRMGKPIEIAKAVAFLLSEDASFITGAEIVVDGGRMLE